MKMCGILQLQIIEITVSHSGLIKLNFTLGHNLGGLNHRPTCTSFCQSHGLFLSCKDLVLINHHCRQKNSVVSNLSLGESAPPRLSTCHMNTSHTLFPPGQAEVYLEFFGILHIFVFFIGLYLFRALNCFYILFHTHKKTRKVEVPQSKSVTGGKAHWTDSYPHLREWLTNRLGYTSRTARMRTGHRSISQRLSRATQKGRASGSEGSGSSVSTPGTPCGSHVVQTC